MENENTNRRMLALSPAIKDYIWGGTRLRDMYGYDGDGERLAEAWVMSAHPDGPSLIVGGEDDGITLKEWIRREDRKAAGTGYAADDEFPLLVKFIDAKDNLSIQVHPDEEFARRIEGQHGKNEMWYVLDSEPGAGLYVGFKRDTSREEVRRRIEDGTITEILNFFETSPGDFFFIPAGTVHAIGAGNLVCETQQSSNVTYRLYDYKRKDKYGRERELHVDKALEVMNLTQYVPERPQAGEDEVITEIVRCDYFTVDICTLHDQKTELLLDEKRFVSVICLEGEGTLLCGEETCDVRSGDSVFVRAVEGTLQMKGNMKLMISRMTE